MVMERVARLQARQERVGGRRTKFVHRKLPLQLYELEPESGEDERLHVDLDLDQLEG